MATLNIRDLFPAACKILLQSPGCGHAGRPLEHPLDLLIREAGSPPHHGPQLSIIDRRQLALPGTLERSVGNVNGIEERGGPGLCLRRFQHDILAALRSHGVESAKIETVFTPAWTTEWMSDEAKAKLVAYGIAAPGHVARDDGLVTLTRRTTAVACPHCGSKNTVVKSEFGATACKSINYCNECLQPFEQFKAI